jgi:hypothetical protein
VRFFISNKSKNFKLIKKTEKIIFKGTVHSGNCNNRCLDGQNDRNPNPRGARKVRSCWRHRRGDIQLNAHNPFIECREAGIGTVIFYLFFFPI